MMHSNYERDLFENESEDEVEDRGAESRSVNFRVCESCRPLALHLIDVRLAFDYTINIGSL